MSWNRCYDLIVKIKRDYVKKKGTLDILNLEKWVEFLNMKEYNDIFDVLQINQFNSFVLVRYGLADMQSGMWTDKDSIFRHCRSIVIDIDKEEIVTCGFDKFFNLNEIEENKIENVIEEMNNARSVEYTDKMDGSMQVARFYNGEIFMNGSMALDEEHSWRLAEGKSFLTDNHKFMIEDNKNLSFIFEYISIKDAHVVNYTKEQEGLYLIGIKGMATGVELTYDEVRQYAQQYNVAMTKIEDISLEEVLDRMIKIQANEKEGWVICIEAKDGNTRKVKVKCDDYVDLHRLLDKVSSINVIIRAVADNTFDDLISKIADRHAVRIKELAGVLYKYIATTNKKINDYYRQADKTDRKSFMIWVSNNVEKEFTMYVRNKYMEKEYNVLLDGSGRYKKLAQIIDNDKDFYKLFNN